MIATKYWLTETRKQLSHRFKKLGLDTADMNNYRPVSNLSFI